MQPVTAHAHRADVSFDGGDLDCGGGLLLLIRQHIDPLPRGGLLEIWSREISVTEDLPAWCRLTGNELISVIEANSAHSFLVCKGSLQARATQVATSPARARLKRDISPVRILDPLPAPMAAPDIRPLSVMGIGSWPRPRWMIQALRERLELRLPEAEFQTTADDAVRLCVDAQRRAGVDVITDGEQRRDSYASFIGARLDNCQLIPLTDLLPLVDDPEKFQQELRALDVPAENVRHPAVFGPLSRSRPIAVHEAEFLKTLTSQPVKIALPGPYLLARTLWMECLSENAYASREHIAQDIVRVLREELSELLAAGVAMVQFDEPVLSEVVFTGEKHAVSFMCGALSQRRDTDSELAFATGLVNAVVAGFPRERVALHLCRGNWTPDESTCLTGDYQPLVSALSRMQVGTYFLELCTPRAGDMQVLKALPDDRRIGVGIVNQKYARIESHAEIMAKAESAIQFFGAHRLLLNPDCGFATFADNPVSAASVAEAKLRAIVEVSRHLRERHSL